MAEIKTINTRIVLRNDDLEKWNNSDKALLKGEAALALRSDGNYEVRIGAADSLSTWPMLSSTGQLIVPVKNIDNLSYTEYQLSNLQTISGEMSRFQLAGKRRDNETWELIGDSPIIVPEVDLAPVYRKIDDLSSQVSAEISCLSSQLSAEISDLSAALSSDISNLSAQLSTEISNLNVQTSSDTDYLSSQISDVEDQIDVLTSTTLVNLSDDLTALAETKATAARLAGELSAQAVRNDLSGYVRYDDVTQQVTEQNKVVTQYDIKDISSAMHFIGTAALSSETDDPRECLVRTFPDAKIGDVALIDLTAAEYVYVSQIKAVAEHWHLIGDESTYATKISLSVEATKRSECDSFLSNAVDSKVKIGSYLSSTGYSMASSDLSIVKIDDNDYYNLVDTESLDPNVVYILSSSQVNAYDTRVVNVGDPISATDAATKGYVDENYVSKSDLSDLSDFSILSNYYKKSETSSASEISSRLYEKVKIGSYLSSAGYSLSSFDLSVVKINSDDYHDLVATEQLDPNAVYVLSSSQINAYDTRIINVAIPSVSSDAATKGYVDDHAGATFVGDYQPETYDLHKQELSIARIALSDYLELIDKEALLSDVMYVVRSENLDACYQRVINVEQPISAYDAVNKAYVDSLSNAYQSKSEMTAYAQKSELTAYAQKSELTAYAQKTDLTSYAQKSELTAYAQKTDLTAYAQKSDTYLRSQLSTFILSGTYEDSSETFSFELLYKL